MRTEQQQKIAISFDKIIPVHSQHAQLPRRPEGVVLHGSDVVLTQVELAKVLDAAQHGGREREDLVAAQRECAQRRETVKRPLDVLDAA